MQYDDILILVSFVVGLEFVVTYHRYSGGEWSKSPMGRHVMAFMAALTVTFAVLLSDFVMNKMTGRGTPDWFEILESIVYTTIPVVLIWRRIMLHRIYKRRRREREVMAVRSKLLNKTFWVSAAERSVVTFAEVLGAMWAADGWFNILDTDWGDSLAVAGSAAVLSLIKSVAALRSGNGPSLTNSEELSPPARKVR